MPPFYTTVTLNAAQILTFGVGVMLLLLEPPFFITVKLNAARIFAVGVGVMLPILLLLVLLLHYGCDLCCPNFPRWYRRYAADFTVVSAVTTPRLRLMLPKFSPLV